MTRLVKTDKDIVIIAMCIDTVWDAQVCALAPILGLQEPMDERQVRPRPPGAKNDLA